MAQRVSDRHIVHKKRYERPYADVRHLRSARRPATLLAMSKDQLRAARPDDRSEVEALLRASDLPAVGLVPDLAGFVVVEAGNGGLVGCAGLEEYGGYGLLRSVAVAAEARGAGLGALLTEAIVAEARRRGLRALYALTTTADRYFPRFGFEVIERSAVALPVQRSGEYAEICASTAVTLRLDLTAG